MTQPHSNVVSVLAGYQHLVKVATISPALRKFGIPHLTLDTGSPAFLHGRLLAFDLGLRRPDRQMILPSFGSTARANGTSTDIMLLQSELASMNAKVVLVYGDLAGSVYAATAARQLGLCVVHVEAGRRSRDPDDPEEYNRLKLDRMSGLLLTPSNEASLNLTEEGLAAKSELVGSTAVERFAQALEVGRSTKWTGSDVVVAIHRNDTLHDPIRMKSVRQLAQQLARSGLKVLMLTYSDISRSHGFDGLSGVHRVTMLERLRFSEYVGMMATASCLITDSTGMQDDAYSIGLPTLTMRTHTHCVESIKAGSNTLVGFDLDLALSIVSDTLDVGCSPLQLDRRVLNFDGAGSRVASAVAAMMAEGLCE